MTSKVAAQKIVAKAADRPIAAGQDVSLFWENVSFSVPLKDVAPNATASVDNNSNSHNPAARQTTDRLPLGTDSDTSLNTASVPPTTLNGHVARNVVWSLSGSVKPGEFVGLLGPSGGGKTVLLNILSDRLTPPPGSLYQRNVYVNNKVPLTRELFGKICTYVMQDDVLMETMTPYECLSFSANLRLSCSPEEKEKHVQDTIALLKLQNCMHTFVRSHRVKQS